MLNKKTQKQIETEIQFLLDRDSISLFLPDCLNPSPRLSYFLSNFFNEQNKNILEAFEKDKEYKEFFTQEFEEIEAAYSFFDIHYLQAGLSPWDNKLYTGFSIPFNNRQEEALFIFDSEPDFYEIKLPKNLLSLALAEHTIYYFSGYIKYDNRIIETYAEKDSTDQEKNKSFFTKLDLIDGGKGFKKTLNTFENTRSLQYDILERARKNYNNLLQPTKKSKKRRSYGN